jgi:rubrerythrin
MKNITEILSEYGITIPEDKQAGFNKVFAENYKTIVEHEKKVNRLTDDLEAEKKRADTAEETLKGFEGKDFEAITRERDEWKRKHDEAEAAHKQEQEEREFNDLLSAAIAESKGKNAKAITALLDLETLRGSKNQEKDIKAALDSVRTDNGYLFEDNGGSPYFTSPGSKGAGGFTKKLSEMSLDERIKLKATNPELYKSLKKGD